MDIKGLLPFILENTFKSKKPLLRITFAFNEDSALISEKNCNNTKKLFPEVVHHYFKFLTKNSDQQSLAFQSHLNLRTDPAKVVPLTVISPEIIEKVKKYLCINCYFDKLVFLLFCCVACAPLDNFPTFYFI
ncbi:hypothetical protein EGR_05563 [Echinococcus granulosus]|uniref:Uncharacterized protein n=1 Tax=Echinococcus granulosus TaxID=6210 RepID=W6UF77_ECHGR|nr:hypothetical protein EGR_05563 [Echinococcus granulosus]EUB59536.1 hypothetical protein EGR_05563 [Echinococcus granulosus]